MILRDICHKVFFAWMDPKVVEVFVGFDVCVNSFYMFLSPPVFQKLHGFMVFLCRNRGSMDLVQARAFGFMETYIVAESEDGQWGHVHFTGPEGYEAGSVVEHVGKMVPFMMDDVFICFQRSGPAPA